MVNDSLSGNGTEVKEMQTLEARNLEKKDGSSELLDESGQTTPFSIFFIDVENSPSSEESLTPIYHKF